MKLLLIQLLAIFAFPIGANTEPASRYKVTCIANPCSEEQLNAMSLVNNKYGKGFEKRLIKNTNYPHPWYWVFRRKDKCKYSVAVREDMPTHMVTMEWIDVDLCRETTNLRTY